MAFYRGNAVPPQFTNLGFSSFTGPDQPKADYPRLKGRGAEIKNLVAPVLMSVCLPTTGAAHEFDSVKALVGSQTVNACHDDSSHWISCVARRIVPTDQVPH